MKRNLREAVRDLPGDADAWFAIGQAAVEAGKSDEARYALLHSVELAPEDLQRAIDAGQLLAHAGFSAEAERLFRGVLQAAPDFAPLRLELARLLLNVGDHAGAREQADRALAVEPRDAICCCWRPRRTCAWVRICARSSFSD
jgi:predicted Zn-dependent protease